MVVDDEVDHVCCLVMSLVIVDGVRLLIVDGGGGCDNDDGAA